MEQDSNYHKGKSRAAKGHLYHSYSAIPWLGQLAWGDHDMFHSNDELAARMMAVSKSISGGPVYLSDDPEKFVPENIMPICYEDGKILRPLAPAAPLPDCLFVNANKESKPYRIIAPLANNTAVVVVYNLVYKKNVSLSGSISAHDYMNATAMMQPYPGKWKVPSEGLVIYNWYEGKARRLEKKYPFFIEEFNDILFIISPIKNGWAVIGRTDKFLSPVAVEVVSVNDRELKIRMIESGPLAVWTREGRPETDGMTFIDAGNGLYKLNMPVGEQDKVITIMR